jgi:hypothetical protein
MLVLPRRVERAFDMAVQRPHDTDARKHRWPSQFHDQHQTFDRGLPLVELLVGLRKYGDIIACVFEGDDLAPSDRTIGSSKQRFQDKVQPQWRIRLA